MTYVDTEKWNVGDTLRTLRLAAEISQTALAREMAARGIPFTQQSVDRIERGIRSLRVEEAARAADVLGIPVSGLVTMNSARIAALAQLLRARVIERRYTARAEQLTAELDGAERGIREAQAMQQEAQAELTALPEDGATMAPQLDFVA